MDGLGIIMSDLDKCEICSCCRFFHVDGVCEECAGSPKTGMIDFKYHEFKELKNGLF